MTDKTLAHNELALTLFEPKREFRWILRVPGIESFLLKSAQRPSFEITKLLGFRRIKPLVIELYDPIEPSGAKGVMSWVDAGDQRDFVIELLEPAGAVVERWSFSKAKPCSVSFGKLDYASNMACTITLTIRYKSFRLDF